MFGIMTKMFGVVILVMFALYTVASIFRSSRRLNARIRELREEEALAAKGGKPINPYEGFAEIYAESKNQAAKSGSAKTGSPKSRTGNR